jgi:hypothetical protein
MEVHNQLGPGHKEITYQNALADKIRRADFAVHVEKRIEIYVGESLVGLLYLDFPPKQIQAWQDRIRRYVWTAPGAQAIRLEIPDPLAEDQAGTAVL